MPKLWVYMGRRVGIVYESEGGQEMTNKSAKKAKSKKAGKSTK
jgi:hypothetical protein